jgi:hypothetical protein
MNRLKLRGIFITGPNNAGIKIGIIIKPERVQTLKVIIKDLPDYLLVTDIDNNSKNKPQ